MLSSLPGIGRSTSSGLQSVSIRATVVIPILLSRSISDTVAFYRKLGFTGGAHGANPSYAILKREDVEIHFTMHSPLDPGANYAACYIRVGEVEALYAQMKSADLPAEGIPRIEPLADKPWGMREFAVVDIDGNLLRIGQVLAP